MNGTEIDVGAIIGALTLLLGGVGYWLRASGKWKEFTTKRAERQEAAAEQARVAEMEERGELRRRFDALADETLRDLRERVSKLEDENGKLEGEVATQRKENEKYRHSLTTMEDALTKAHSARAEETARWRDTQTNLERDLEILREQAVSLRQRVDSLESELERKTQELNAVRADQRNYKETLREMELYKVKLEAINESLVKENANLTAMVERVLSALKPPEPRTIGEAGA